AGARPGGLDDVLTPGECLHVEPGEVAGVVQVAGVPGGLTAAGLAGGEVDLDPVAPEQPVDRLADLRGEVVGQAGDEERDFHRGTSHHWMRPGTRYARAATISPLT